ncbi:hypothetical protein B14911_04959 [Bacillus sp. NRRL B-14911]|nr:hypothetical protein B14911_04959 [Bacillus sp. NRRL B-14911]
MVSKEILLKQPLFFLGINALLHQFLLPAEAVKAIFSER